MAKKKVTCGRAIDDCVDWLLSMWRLPLLLRQSGYWRQVFPKNYFPKQGFSSHSSDNRTLQAQQPTLTDSSEPTKEFSATSFFSDPSVQQLLEPFVDENISEDTKLPEEISKEWGSKLDAVGKKLAYCKLQGKDRQQLRVNLIRKLQETTGIVLPSDVYHKLHNKQVIDVVVWYEQTLREQLYHNSLVEEYIRKTFPSNVRLDPSSYRKPERRTMIENK